jgi:hypothetical protein
MTTQERRDQFDRLTIAFRGKVRLEAIGEADPIEHEAIRQQMLLAFVEALRAVPEEPPIPLPKEVDGCQQ